MSEAQQCNDGGGVSVSGQEAEGDGEPPHGIPLPSQYGAEESVREVMGQEEEVPPAAKQQRLDNDGMAINCEVTLTPACLQEEGGHQNHASPLSIHTGERVETFSEQPVLHFFVLFWISHTYLNALLQMHYNNCLCSVQNVGFLVTSSG